MELNEILYWFLRPWKQFIVFKGRANQKELLTFILVNAVIFVVWRILLNEFGSFIKSSGAPGTATAFFYDTFSTLYDIYVFGLTIPVVALAARRLHDMGRSGWYCLFFIVPFFGPILTLILALFRGERGTNQYGPDPDLTPLSDDERAEVESTERVETKNPSNE